MAGFAGGIEPTPADGVTLALGLSLALPNAGVRRELVAHHAAGVPYSALLLAHHGGGQCKTILTARLAAVLLGSLEEFWDLKVATLPVDQFDQLAALRADARFRFRKVAEHPDAQ
jgi:hypothetical protein